MSDGSRRIYYREDMEYRPGRLTIEKQLQLYEKHPDKSERAATLWHAWQQNKRWLIRLLELTLASFPSYSRHDASHAEAVIHNIERVLGEERIAQLSATDCFAILHTVYIHDIGMVILANDRERIVESDEFVEMIEDLVDGADNDLKNAARLLKKNYYYEETNEEIDYDSSDFYNAKKKLYVDKLETYYAVVQLLAEYQRKCHGEKAASNVKDGIFDKDKLRAEFTTSGVPMRIFFRIADCARLHTDWEFQHILELPTEENGYENDMLHPQFIAVMLQLGDALDIDNNRFHPFAHAFSGHFPIKSQDHYNKHLAIRTLKITPEEIVVEADCETREAMRLIRNECDGIERLLKSTSYYWSSIAPKGFSGALPSFKLSKFCIKGKEVPWDLVMTRFQISQQKAFSLLQSENIYSGYFPFVRELLQNAIDATKLQCYEDYTTSSKFRFERERKNHRGLNITNISRIINPVEYPIEISIQCCEEDANGTWKFIALEDLPEKEEKVDIKYGILFSIKDYGTGISTETLRNISNVESSYKSRKSVLREIPEWLRPTGEFGIGLQSIFLVSDNFFCDTYVRNGECHRIEFLTGANGKNGYINVEPGSASDADKPMTYGTEFQVFISHEKRKEHQEYMDARTGYDPFDHKYGGKLIRRNIIGLTMQILLDIDSQLEDLLFPVYVSVKFELGEKQSEYLKSKLSKIVLDNKKGNNYTEEKLREHMCWIYREVDKDNEDHSTIRYGIENGICQIDLKQMKIYLWLDDLAVSACIGVDRMISDRFQTIQSSCKLYYKGMLIHDKWINNSGNLLEYIDIQGGRRGRKLIQLNRNGLTSEGQIYVNTVLIPRIYSNLFQVLRTLANQKFPFANDKGTELSFSEKIRENMERAFSERKGYLENNWQKQLVGISLYYNFYMSEMEKRQSIYLSKHEEAEKAQWSKAIKNVSAVTRENRGKGMDDIHCALITTEVFADLESKVFMVLNRREITIADFYNEENKFAVVSKRRDKGDKWINSLIWLKDTEKTETENAEEETIEEGVRQPALIELLENSLTAQMRWSDKADKLDEWSAFMLDNIGGILEQQSIQQSNAVLSLLQSVSISACFTDVSGNLKVHILSGRPLGSVFYNVYAKYGLLKKMASRKRQTNAERFAGNVWMGYELLQVYKIPEDICNIKEQYIQPSESLMVFPCTGEAAQMLVQIVDPSEEEAELSWIWKELYVTEFDEYLEYLKKILVDTAEMLYACIVMKYEQVLSADGDYFEDRYAWYCRHEKAMISQESFWNQLNSGYSLLLGNALREKLRDNGRKIKRDSWKQVADRIYNIESLREQVEERIPAQEKMKELKQVINREILSNSEDIIGAMEISGDQGGMLRERMEELIGYCIDWEWSWNLVEHLQVEQEIKRIKRNLVTNAEENEKLTVWISEQVNVDQCNVAECYDRIWDELIRAVIWQRGEKFAEKHHFMLLDWMKKKEDCME